MPDTIIKYFFVYLSCTYIYNHLINQKTAKKTYKSLYICLSLALSILTYILKLHFPVASYVVPIMSFWLIFCLQTASPQLSVITTSISFGISYSVFILSSSILLIFFTPICYRTDNFPYSLFMFLAGLLEIALIFLLFRQKRFCKGMPFLYSKEVTNIGTIICLLGLIVLTYMQAKISPAFGIALLFPALFIITVFILIYWWQSQLTKSYRRKLQALELESLRNELQEKSLLLERLQLENSELSRLIHKDNKLIPAMENAVYEYLQSTPSDQVDGLSMGPLLLEELHNLSKSRHDILSRFTPLNAKSFSTDIVPLDALLNYMNKKIASLSGNFSVNISQTTLSLLTEIITVDNLVHLLADLIENAAISISSCPSRDIRLQIYQYGKCPIIELSDTGIPFEIHTLTNLGIKAVTTHAESGGTGIGLMDVWEIKKKYKASLHIIEYESASPFQKKVSLLFDRKNQYLIYTWREETIKPFVQRIDLHVLANNMSLD